MPEHIIYLNVTVCPKHSVNGILFVLQKDDLNLFDVREAPTYERVNITNQLKGVRLTQGEGYMYSAKPKWLLREERSPEFAAIRQSYLDKVAEGVDELGEEFGRAYRESTEPVPYELVIQDTSRKEHIDTTS